MAVGEGVMPNGRNKFGGRKPAMPATQSKGEGSNPPAGAPRNANISAGKPTPTPSRDLDAQPAVSGGTHIGSTAHMPGDPGIPKRRDIKADAK